MNAGIALTFACKTTSPFHTTRQEYSNLVKCAPFILGSTLRGAILTALIEREVCPHTHIAQTERDPARLGAAHRACANPACPIEPFFPEQTPLIWFSFGEFKSETARLYRAATRIALERETGSVAEGAIVTIESIAPDTPFEFSVTLFGDAQRLADDVEWAVNIAAQTQGIGRFRSIGYGQFRVEGAARRVFAECVESASGAWQNVESVTAEFATPYIIGNGNGQVDALNRTEFPHRIREQMQQTLEVVGLDAPPIADASLMLTPEYVSRFSYEQGAPQHRLVAWEHSRLRFTLAQANAETQRALAAVSLLGLGEWSDCGFGQLRA